MRTEYSKRARILIYLAYFFVSAFCLAYNDAPLHLVLYQAVGVGLAYVVLFPFWTTTQDFLGFLNKLETRFSSDQKGAIYSWLVIIVFLVIVCGCWFVSYAVMTPLEVNIDATMTAYSNHTAYTVYGYANTFMQNLWVYMLAIACIALFLWVVHYEQRRGVSSYY